MTGKPADDTVLRLLDETGLADDAALAAVLEELRATTLVEPPAPSRDVARLMSGRRPVRSTWFARRGTKTTTVVLLAAALAGGASAAAAASPALHTVVGDAFSSVAKLLGAPTHPEPAVPKNADGHGSSPDAGSTDASDLQGGGGPREASNAKDGSGAQEDRAGAAEQGTASSDSQNDAAGRNGAVARNDDPANGDGGAARGVAHSTPTAKPAPARTEPGPAPAPSPAPLPGDSQDSPDSQGGSPDGASSGGHQASGG